jgi:hypothetical protein
VQPVLDLVELGTGVLPEHAASSPELAEARERACLLCAWVNDVYSFAKESAAGDPLNLVSVLARQYRLSVHEAVGAAAEVFNTDLAILEELTHRLAGGLSGSDPLSVYLTGVHDWVQGNLAWTGLCGRYLDRV